MMLPVFPQTRSRAGYIWIGIERSRLQAHVIVLQARSILPHEARNREIPANQGGTAKMNPFRPLKLSICLPAVDERGYLRIWNNI